jgi:RNA polymerase sigma factor (sigma-70 family)
VLLWVESHACNPIQAGAEYRERSRRGTLQASGPGQVDVVSPAKAGAGDTPDRDWDHLMTATQAGDVSAYKTLLADLALWLHRYYARRLPPAMIEDAVQDVLLAVHEKRHTYDPSRPFGVWLAAIARYKWIDRLRFLKADASEPLDESIGIPDHGDAVIAGTILRQLLAELKPPQAVAIRLVKLEGYSVEEASAATGQSVSLVKVNIHRGLKRLTAIVRTAGDAD